MKIGDSLSALQIQPILKLLLVLKHSRLLASGIAPAWRLDPRRTLSYLGVTFKLVKYAGLLQAQATRSSDACGPSRWVNPEEAEGRSMGTHVTMLLFWSIG